MKTGFSNATVKESVRERAEVTVPLALRRMNLQRNGRIRGIEGQEMQSTLDGY